MRKRWRRAGVVGGGIAGLGTAIALRARGWDVTVYERAERLTEVGAGVFLSVNALRALDALGVGDQVRTHAIANSPCTVRNHRGRVLINARIDDLVGSLVPMHRAELIAILASALPAECVRLGATVVDVGIDGSIETRTGTTRYDLVVAADGVHSRIRHALWPQSGAIRHTGITAWRWIVDAPAPESIGYIWGRHAECGVVPLGTRRTIAYAAARPVVKSLDHFRYWPEPIATLIADTNPSRIVTNELLEIAVPPTLWKGRVALVGDAGHAMRPTLGQGACLALEDAVMLADSAPDLAGYSSARRRRVAAMGLLARQSMWLLEPGSAVLAAMRDTVIAATPDALALRLLRIAGRAIGGWHPPASFAPTSTQAESTSGAAAAPDSQ